MAAPLSSGSPGSGGDLAARAECALADLLQQSHLLRPDAIEEVFGAAVRPLGIAEVRVYLADLQQRQLESLPIPDGQNGHRREGADGREGAKGSESLAIDSTIAGYAFRTVTIQHVPAAESQGGYRVWVPLVDGTERLGVLSLLASDIGEAMLDRCRALASLAGLVIVAKSSYSDTYAQVRRSGRMALQAELIWGFLVPRTFATDRVLVAATLEPAYEAGGDAFDYSVLGDHLNVSIFDALGHDLAAGLLASVGVASCRSTRRAGGTLSDVVRRADSAIAGQFADIRFVTALVCDLDLSTGLFSWIPCGHPPPLLIRGNKVIKELARRPVPPLGLGGIHSHGQPDEGATAPVYTERLEPGDRVLLYTDGVTEGRSADGTPFGLDRLSDFIIRHSNDGIPAPETMRRLNHAISEYQRGRLQDDATIVLVEWLPDHPERNLIPLCGGSSWVPGPVRPATFVTGPEAARSGFARLTYMESDELDGAAALRWTDPGRADPGWPDAQSARRTAADSAEAAVGALYDAAAVGLIRLAYLMLGDRPSAEDVLAEQQRV